MNSENRLIVPEVIEEIQQIDFKTIIRLIAPFIEFYIARKVMQVYYLKKDYKPVNIKKVVLPTELIQEESEVDYEKFASEWFGEEVVNFAKFMEKEFPQADLTNFYNNINKLVINPYNTRFKRMFFKVDKEGSYYVKSNLIKVDEHYYISAIYHELFHMASSTYKDGTSYCGFSQTTNNIKVGAGLNEGYTQLLTERYFGHISEEIKGSYFYLVQAAKQLERIIGQEKMTSLYLTANLNGLINELKEYTSEEEISALISGLDFVVKHLTPNPKLPLEKGMIDKSLKNVNEILLKIYVLKVKKLFMNDEINSEEMLALMQEYADNAGWSIMVGEKTYELLTTETANNIFKNCLGDKDFKRKMVEDRAALKVS